MGQYPSKIHTKLIQTLKDSADDHNNWSNIAELGDGAFGKVYKTINKKTAQIGALKEIKIEDDIEDYLTEVAILSEIQHSNIIGYITSYLYQPENTIYLYLEFCKYGSFDLIIEELAKSGDELSEAQIKAVMRSVLEGLSYLHDQRIIHRDIKSSNIMLNESATVKIADFGVAAQMNPEDAGRNSFIGTPYWMAPEVISCETDRNLRYNTSADIWSVGITAIELAQGKPPHDDMMPLRVGLVIIQSEPPELENKNRRSNLFVNFISDALIKNPLHRPTAQKLLNSDFVTKDFDQTALKSLACFLSGELVLDKIIEYENSTTYDKDSSDPILHSQTTETSGNDSITSRPVLVLNQPPSEDNSPRINRKFTTLRYRRTYIDIDGEMVVKEMKNRCSKDLTNETTEITTNCPTISKKHLKKKNLQQYRKWQDRNRKIFKLVKREVLKSHDELIVVYSDMVNKLFHKLTSDMQKYAKKRNAAIYTACSDANAEYKQFLKKLSLQETKDVKFYRKSLKQEFKRQSKVCDRSTISCFEKNIIVKEMDFVSEIKHKNAERNLDFFINRIRCISDIDADMYQEKIQLISICIQNLNDLKKNYQLEMEKLLLCGLTKVYDSRLKEQEERFQMNFSILVLEERQSFVKLDTRDQPTIKKLEKKIKINSKSKKINEKTFQEFTEIKNRHAQESERMHNYFSEQFSQLKEEKEIYISYLEQHNKYDEGSIRTSIATKLAELEENQMDSSMEELIAIEKDSLNNLYSEYDNREILPESFTSLLKMALAFDVSKPFGVSFEVDW